MKKENGKYIITKLMRYTNTELTGIGETVEEARAKLKEEVKKYQEGLRMGVSTAIKITGETINSPGAMVVKREDGSYAYVYNPQRKINVIARPDIADMRGRDGRKDK